MCPVKSLKIQIEISISVYNICTLLAIYILDLDLYPSIHLYKILAYVAEEGSKPTRDHEDSLL